MDSQTSTRWRLDTTYHDYITTRIPMRRWGQVNQFNGPTMLLASRLVLMSPLCDPAGEIFMTLTTIFHSLTGHTSLAGGWLAEGYIF